MKSNISSDMNKPCWKLVKACPQSQKLFCFRENNLLVILVMFLYNSTSVAKTRECKDEQLCIAVHI